MATDITGRFLAVAYGGGVNSTAFLIEFVRLGIKPGLILFSDTGGERPATYAFVKQFSDWLVSKGFPAIVTVSKTGRTFNAQGQHENLEENCLRMHRLPSIAYGFKTCSEKYKSRAQEKFIRHYPPTRAIIKAGGKLVKVIGFDAGEERRAKPYEHPMHDNWYPLIEWGWDRAKCEQVVRGAGFHPAKSSCFFCPSMTKPEILQLGQEYPELLERAMAMEDNAKDNLVTVKGLGRRFNWREFIEAHRKGDPKACKWDGDVETPCGCYDG